MQDVLLQYGAVGVIALLALAAVRVLFKDKDEAHQEAVARADRLEAELRKLNETVQTQYLTTLAQATLAMQQALQAFEAIREMDSERRSGKG